MTKQIEASEAGKNKHPAGEKRRGHKHWRRRHRYDPRTEPRERTIELMRVIARREGRRVVLDHDKGGHVNGAHFE